MSSDGRIDPVKLEAWIAKSRIDPNDPENEELMIRQELFYNFSSIILIKPSWLELSSLTMTNPTLGLWSECSVRLKYIYDFDQVLLLTPSVSKLFVSSFSLSFLAKIT